MRIAHQLPKFMFQIGSNFPKYATNSMLSRRQLGTLSLDITGNNVHLSKRSIVTDLDQAIMMVITGEEDPLDRLRSIIELNKDCGMGYCLLALELIRKPALKNHGDEFYGCLSALENLAQKDKLTFREKYFASAAITWSLGYYLLAAAYFETSSLESSCDILATKFAQECYLAAGDSRNVFACVARCPQLGDYSFILQGHLQCMLALGHLEMGRLQAAEETALSALGRTRGRDLCGLSALMGSLQLLGRSSELTGVIEEYGANFGLGSPGHPVMLYHAGSSLVQKGNYSGAVGTLMDLLRALDPPERRTSSDTSLTFALLWQLAMNAADDNVDGLCMNLASLCETVLDLPAQPVDHIFRGLVLHLAGARSAGDALVRPYALVTAEVNPPTPEGWAAVYSIFSGRVATEMPGLGRQTGGACPEPRPGYKAIDLIHRHRNSMLGSESEEAVDAESLQLSRFRVLCPSLMTVSAHPAMALPLPRLSPLRLQWERESHSNIRDESEGPGGGSRPGRGKSSHGTASLAPSALEACIRKYRNDSRDIIAYLSLPVLDAAAALINGDSDGAATSLLMLQRGFARLGGSRVQRDVLEQTLIEALLRADRLQEASFWLTERTTLAPNDAQAWRRLASVLGLMGQTRAAESAHHTAYQLGIGQGGFGGPV